MKYPRLSNVTRYSILATCGVAAVLALAIPAMAQRRNGGGGGGGARNGNTRTYESSASTASAFPTTGPAGDFDHFKVITEQNMFIRNRVRPQPPRPPTIPTVSRPLRDEEVFVLRGVVIDQEQHVLRAHFEDTRNGAAVVVNEGDALAHGHVAEIAIDAVAFENEGALIWVRVGDNLIGTRVAAPVVSLPATPTTTPSGEPGTTQPSDANLSDIERRMRERAGRKPQ